MAQINGSVSGIGVDVDLTSRAARYTLRPNDIGALGSYRVAVFSGLTTGLAAGAPVFAFRWADATRLALMRFVAVRAQVVTGFTAAQQLSADIVIARSFTVSDTAGTAIVLGTGNKKRASMGNSLVTDLRIATAAALTAGTRTLDANPFTSCMTLELAAAATVPRASMAAIVDARDQSDYPIVLVANEGFVVRNLVALGAGGTVAWSVECAWDEVASY